MNDLAHELQNSTPFDLSQQEINDLYEEAKVWLDGEEVKTQEQADTIAKLLDLTRKATKTAESARKAEKKPHDDAGKEVQARYKPLADRADLIAKACKDAVTPFLTEQDRQKREAARIAQEQADAAERAAQEAALQSKGAGIEQKDAAENLITEAKKSQAAATKLSKDKGHAKGGDRALGLRSTYTPELTDLSAAIKHYWARRQPDFEALVCQLAAKDVRDGVREIPGFEIKETKVAV